MTETFVRELRRPSPPSHGSDEPLGELALRVARETCERVDALARVVEDNTLAIAKSEAAREEEAKERAAEAKARAKRTVRNVLGGSSAVTVLVALIGGAAQIQVSRNATVNREQTKEVASQTAADSDNRAMQIAQRANELGYQRGLAERARETAPLRVAPDASALARKESFE